MGLDLEPIGRAKVGYEAEWAGLLKSLYAGEELSNERQSLLLDICIPPYSEIGAPQVGVDDEANRWIIQKARAAGETKTDAEIIEQTRGHYAVELLLGQSDGVPPYSNAPFGYVEATSFRGEFLKDCIDLLDGATINLAWRKVIPPQEAIRYGKLLLSRLDRPPAQTAPLADALNSLGRLMRGGGLSMMSVQEQRQVIDVAGRWYVFWGSRGNPIWANF